MTCAHPQIATHTLPSGEKIFRCNICAVQQGLAKPKLPKAEGSPFKPVYGDAGDKPIRKEGDIWKLPRANSPMWTSQWGYQGSAKTPYIISKKPTTQANGATTIDGWACSCSNFTRHTPRTDCKHILKVIVSEGLGPKTKAQPVGVASLTDADEKAFLEWKRQQAAAKGGNKPTASAKLALFGATTRKFR